MKVHNGFNGININRAVVTTGSFDGVHVGHQVIIDRLKMRAAELGGETVLITFYPHPRKVLYPESAGKDLKMISSQEEKIKRLESLGLDHLIIVNFTLEFSKTSSVDFIRKYLVQHLHVAHVIIGFNHHFGHNREGDIEYLVEIGKYYGFSVEEIPEQDIHQETVSSTKIRKALTEGNIQRANAYLDHSFLLSGWAVRHPERDDGLWQLSEVDQEKLLPPPGSYAVSCRCDDDRFKGVSWILPKGETSSVDVFFRLDHPDPIRPGGHLILEFHKNLRNGSQPMLSLSMIEAEMQTVRDLIY